MGRSWLRGLVIQDRGETTRLDYMRVAGGFDESGFSKTVGLEWYMRKWKLLTS